VEREPAVIGRLAQKGLWPACSNSFYFSWPAYFNLSQSVPQNFRASLLLASLTKDSAEDGAETLVSILRRKNDAG
jgi:hypothetical protein